jgi:hypothetical protein
MPGACGPSSTSLILVGIRLDRSASQEVMTAVLEMASITECSVVGCSYNDHSGCNAFAVTIGGSGASAGVRDIHSAVRKGGLSKVVGHVGACQRADCVHNESLECSATSVRIGAGSDTADCLTFQPR